MTKDPYSKMNGDMNGEELEELAGDTEVLIKDQTSNEILNGESIEPSFASVDEIFEKIGPCGLYQYIWGFALCILNIPMTYQILIMYFTGHSSNWKCVNGTNPACNFTGEVSPAEVDKFNTRCSMPRHSWEFVTPRSFSFVTEVDFRLFALIH